MFPYHLSKQYSVRLHGVRATTKPLVATTGTLMIEPTESEPKSEMDRFIAAMIAIRGEIREIEEGKVDRANNVLKHAPHTQEVVCADHWDRPYSREKAAYPVASLRRNKFWPTISRIDNVFGDRKVVPKLQGQQILCEMVMEKP